LGVHPREWCGSDTNAGCSLCAAAAAVHHAFLASNQALCMRWGPGRLQSKHAHKRNARRTLAMHWPASTHPKAVYYLLSCPCCRSHWSGANCSWCSGTTASKCPVAECATVKALSSCPTGQLGILWCLLPCRQNRGDVILAPVRPRSTPHSRSCCHHCCIITHTT
jgi:hypothetical protein